MADRQELKTSLTAAQFAAVRAALDAGEYATSDEIVSEAIRDWAFKRGFTDEELRRLRQLWDEGIASGPAAKLDFDQLRVEAARRLKRVKAAAKFGG